MKLEVGQIWRKQGPYGWLKIEQILAPGYTEYDGGCPGCVARYYPPQLKGIKLRGGKTYFLAGDWEVQVQRNRFLLVDGQPANMLRVGCVRMDDPDELQDIRDREQLIAEISSIKLGALRTAQLREIKKIIYG